MDDTPRMGRPPVDNPRNRELPRVRLTSEEEELIRTAAAARGKTISAWVRDVILRAAKRTK